MDKTMVRTGAELKAARKSLKLSRKALASLSGIHMDTVRYWERKPRLDLSGHAVSRMLDALGFGDWRAKESEIRRLRRVRKSDIGQTPALMMSKPIPNSSPASNEVFLEANARARGRNGVIEIADNLLISVGAQTCGARTRAGHPCKSRVIYASGRCKNHGGKSTGPRTAEGKARIAEAQRKRWVDYRRKAQSRKVFSVMMERKSVQHSPKN